MLDPEITMLLKPLHSVYKHSIENYSEIFKSFQKFWFWTYDCCAWNKEEGYTPCVAFNKDQTEFDWSQCKQSKKIKDLGLEVARLERKRYKHKISLSDSLKIHEFNMIWRPESNLRKRGKLSSLSYCDFVILIPNIYSGFSYDIVLQKSSGRFVKLFRNRQQEIISLKYGDV